MTHRQLTMYEYRRLLRRRLRRMAKAKREQIAGMIGLVAVIIGLITAGLNLPQPVPIGFCTTGAITLVLTHHFSQRP